MPLNDFMAWRLESRVIYLHWYFRQILLRSQGFIPLLLTVWLRKTNSVGSKNRRHHLNWDCNPQKFSVGNCKNWITEWMCAKWRKKIKKRVALYKTYYHSKFLTFILSLSKGPVILSLEVIWQYDPPPFLSLSLSLSYFKNVEYGFTTNTENFHNLSLILCLIRVSSIFFIHLFIYGLFNDPISSSDYAALNNEWKEAVWSNLKYYPGIFLMTLKKIIKTLRHDSQSRTEMWTRDLPKTKQNYYLLFYNVWCLIATR
jgi:hypothetical protein